MSQHSKITNVQKKCNDDVCKAINRANAMLT